MFDAALAGRVDQRDVLPPVTEGVEDLLDTRVEGGVCTATGLRENVAVGLAYLTAWLGGRGAAAVNDLMEDVATAEVSRCQVWQWIHHGVTLTDGQVTTVELVSAMVDEESAALIAAGADEPLVRAAAGVFRDVALSPELPPFLTLVRWPCCSAPARPGPGRGLPDLATPPPSTPPPHPHPLP